MNKDKWLSPDVIALLTAAGTGGLAEVLGKLGDLDITAADFWPVFAIVGLVWLKETIRDARGAKAPDEDRLIRLAERGATDVKWAVQEELKNKRLLDRSDAELLIKVAAEEGAQSVIDKLRSDES